MENTTRKIAVIWQQKAYLDAFLARLEANEYTTIVKGVHKWEVSWNYPEDFMSTISKEVYSFHQVLCKEDEYALAGMQLYACHYTDGDYSASTINYLSSRIRRIT
jgi:hypothetical protein